MQPEQNTTFTRRDVETFVLLAQHAVHVGGLDSATRYTVEAALQEIVRGLDVVEPRWDVLRTQATHLRNSLAEAAPPAVVRPLEGLPWP